MSANEKPDVLFHFALSTEDTDFKSSFGDAKFILCGGSSNRMLHVAEYLAENIPIPLTYGTQLKNLSKTDRYVLYKVGPILCVNHGIGEGSCLIMLHEITKLLKHAGVKDPLFLRMGTCGGIGLDGGTIVISEKAMNPGLRSEFETYRLGKRVVYDCSLDKFLIQELVNVCKELNVKYATGITIASNDFYEEQGRLDGALCTFTVEEKQQFLKQCYDLGVRNFEMESTGFSSFCKRAGIRAAVVCVTLLNRFNGDQLTESKSTYEQYELTLIRVITALIRKLMNSKI